MALRFRVRVLTRATLHGFTSQPPTFPTQKIQSFSATANSHYRKQISLANVLQRYGFPTSQLHNFLTRHNFLLNFTSLELEKSLGILLKLKIPQKSLASLISDCPGVLEFEFLRKWEMGFSEFGFLGASPLMIMNVLELARRFQLDPDGFSRSVKVLRGFGVSDGTVSRVLEGFPRVIMMNEKEIHRRIEFLMGIGIPRNEIDRFFCSFPSVLRFGVEDRLKPLLSEFRDLGFSEDMVRKEIVREPRILGMELGEISRCLELLRTLKCREAIKEKIFIEGACRAGFEVKLRVDCLCKHGLIRREAFKVLWKEPRLIIYEIEDIEKKIEFLVQKMKFSVSCLVDVPEYLGVNFEKQIVPRYNVIEYLRAEGGLGFELGLKDLIKPSRLRFYNLYVKPYPECEKMFGRFSGNVEVKSRPHPAGLWKLFEPQRHSESKEDVKNMKCFMETLV
uniref:Transcription termination factor MTERF15, mitochondrial n=1 Tax=Fagus sylvatica TaxID=28930 RepID=A0A2N9HFL5_FAGSY